MENIDKQKKRFLDGEITAFEYESILVHLEKEKEVKATKDDSILEINNKNVNDSYNGIFFSVFFVIVFVIFIFIKSAQKTTDSNVENSLKTAPEKTKREKVLEDSIYMVQREKEIKIELAKEAIFIKSKAGRIYKKHPEWSKEDCERLANNKIWIGMDFDMLKYRRGLPNSANPSNYGNGITQWQWCWHDYTPSCYYDTDGDGKIDSYN